MTIELRRATREDVPFLARLLGHADVAPYLAASRATTEAELAAEVARSLEAPDAFGLLVIELGGEPAGTVSWESVNRRSRIASVSGYAIDPSRQGQGIGVPVARAIQRYLIRELGFHRLQMEVYGFNERALRHAERAGWIREGVRRKAYLRDDAWVDGIMFGLVEEDLDDRPVVDEGLGSGTNERPRPERRVTTGETFDVAVLGGGLAGITGALEARKRGARVVLFEPGPVGGT